MNWSLEPARQKTGSRIERCSAPLFDFNQDILAGHEDFIAMHIFDGGWSECFAAGEIELCAMPGTYHAPVVHGAFTKRSAVVRAIIINGVKRSLNVE